MLFGSLTGRDTGLSQVPLLGKPRRILMTTDAVGGVWRWSVDAAEGLNDRGIEVVLACVGPAPGNGHQADVQRLTDTSLVHIDEPLDWMAGTERDLEGLARRIHELVAHRDVDLIHLNVASQAAGLCAPCPVVTMSHSCVATWFQAVRGGPPPPGWSWQVERTRRGLRAADVVIAPSASHAAAVTEIYGAFADLRVVPNAVRWPPSSVAKEPFVLAAARWWDEGKNAAVLDRAAALSPWPVVMAGALASPGGGPIVIRNADAPGELAGREVRSLMARASIFVAPSIYEPFGLAPMEAALAGCALICADIPTFREIWDGAAVFSDPGDPMRFAALITRLAADPEMCATLGEHARERAAAFSPNRQIDALTAIYSDACRAVPLPDASAAE